MRIPSRVLFRESPVLMGHKKRAPRAVHVRFAHNMLTTGTTRNGLAERAPYVRFVHNIRAQRVLCVHFSELF